MWNEICCIVFSVILWKSFIIPTSGIWRSCWPQRVASWSLRMRRSSVDESGKKRNQFGWESEFRGESLPKPKVKLYKASCVDKISRCASKVLVMATSWNKTKNTLKSIALKCLLGSNQNGLVNCVYIATKCTKKSSQSVKQYSHRNS